jgi:hypothetical protein
VAGVTPLAREAIAFRAESDREPAVAARVAPVAVELRRARLERAVEFAALAVGARDTGVGLL